MIAEMYEQYDHEIILQKIVSALQIDIIKAKLIQQNQGLAAAFKTAVGEYKTILSHRYSRSTLSFATAKIEWSKTSCGRRYLKAKKSWCVK